MVIEGTGLPDRYGLIGHPVAHSRSPFVHERFAAQTGELLRYELIDAPPETFEETVRRFFGSRGKGLNVTLPHKPAALALADSLSERARIAGAVNTLTSRPGGRLEGDNTDGAGLVRDLVDNLGLELRGARILLAGAGGAARGVLGPLLAQAPRALRIANRTRDRAHRLAEAFRELGPVSGTGYGDVGDERFELVLNATSASLTGERPALPDPLANGAVCYDMVYQDEDTPFTRWARAHGALRVYLGWGMLVEQAAETFFIWRKVRPDTGPVLAQLRR